MDTILTFIAIVLFCLLGVAMVIMLIIQHQLYAYLRKKHRNKWEELTTVGKYFGPGMANSFRGFGFLLSSEIFDDPMIKRLKNRTIYSILTVLLLFGIIPWIMVVIFVVFGFLRYA